jgi:hypothetical protein
VSWNPWRRIKLTVGNCGMNLLRIWLLIGFAVLTKGESLSRGMNGCLNGGEAIQDPKESALDVADDDHGVTLSQNMSTSGGTAQNRTNDVIIPSLTSDERAVTNFDDKQSIPTSTIAEDVMGNNITRDVGMETISVHTNTTIGTRDDLELETKFLSFEEWRKLNLEKSGQFDHDFTQRQEQPSRKASTPPTPNFVEDDLEIDIGMFASDEQAEQETAGKLYKERFNYASFDCAATIVKTNTNTKGASNILNENKDTYLINQCAESNKFVIIELCNDILVDTVEIANYEFFSSMFRHLRVSVADRFPVPASSWRALGEFEAKSVRDLQRFHIANPLIWARYLRIEFLTHWGHEFYCPISLVRVHGTTMMDAYRNQERISDVKASAVAGIEEVKQEDNQVPLCDPYLESPLGTADTCSPKPSTTVASSTGGFSILDVYQTSKPTIGGFSPLVLNESCRWDEYQNEYYSSQMKLNATIVSNPPEPKTQDSIYQTIMKRLSLLESNATLSLKYIEEQSQNLRELLVKIEKTQNSRIEQFFEDFNNTVTTQMRIFQQQYTRILLSTVDEMEAQRVRVNRDMMALSSRLSLVAEEVTYQKKLGIAQAVILLMILIFVITTRGTPMDAYPLQMGTRNMNWSGSISGLWSGAMSPRPSQRRDMSEEPSIDFSPETGLSGRHTSFGLPKLSRPKSMPPFLDHPHDSDSEEDSHKGGDTTSDENEPQSGYQALSYPSPTPSDPT